MFVMKKTMYKFIKTIIGKKTLMFAMKKSFYQMYWSFSNGKG